MVNSWKNMEIEYHEALCSDLCYIPQEEINNQNKTDMKNMERSNNTFAKILFGSIAIAIIVIACYFMFINKHKKNRLEINKESITKYKGYEIHQLLYSLYDSGKKDSVYGIVTNMVYDNCTIGCVPYISEVRTWYKEKLEGYSNRELNEVKTIIDGK